MREGYGCAKHNCHFQGLGHCSSQSNSLRITAILKDRLLQLSSEVNQMCGRPYLTTVGFSLIDVANTAVHLHTL